MVVCGLATKRKQQSGSLGQLQKETDSERNKKQTDNKCTICQLMFTNDLELSKHTAYEHNKKRRTCYHCDMVFNTMSTVEWVVVQHEHEESNC